jgi:hypothetical protein
LKPLVGLRLINAYLVMARVAWAILVRKEVYAAS